jgi:hypothetical protein
LLHLRITTGSLHLMTATPELLPPKSKTAIDWLVMRQLAIAAVVLILLELAGYHLYQQARAAIHVDSQTLAGTLKLPPAGSSATRYGASVVTKQGLVLLDCGEGAHGDCFPQISRYAGLPVVAEVEVAHVAHWRQTPKLVQMTLASSGEVLVKKTFFTERADLVTNDHLTRSLWVFGVSVFAWALASFKLRRKQKAQPLQFGP